MNHRILKGFLAAFFTFFIMIFLSLGISGFLGHRLVQGKLRNNDQIARMMGQVVGTMISNLRSELNEGIVKGQDKFNTKWSALFNKMADDSRNRKDIFRIEEVFLINRKGEFLAHSDVTRLSKFHAEKDDMKDYVRIGSRSPDNPSLVRILSVFENEDLMHPELYKLVSTYYPDLIAETYSIGVAVFPVDSTIANASLHLTIRNTTYRDFINHLKVYAVKILIFDFALSVFISLLVMVFVMIFAGKKQKSGSSKNTGNRMPREIKEMPSGMEIIESSSPQRKGVLQESSRRSSVILDAIPLEDIKKR